MEMSQNKLELFHESKKSVAFITLLELIQEEIDYYDELVAASPLDLAAIVRQQQAIGSKSALKRVLHEHEQILKNKLK